MGLADKNDNVKFFKNQKTLLLFVCFPVGLSFCYAQQKTLRYAVVSKTDSVGNMQATQKVSGDEAVYNASSTVEVKVLMTVKVDVREEAHFHKDKLILSSSKRVVNDKLKGNKQTKAVADGYIVTAEGKESKLNQKMISYDFLRLYFKEPAGITQIYSDYYQKVLIIKTLSPHTYKIDLPEGGSNTYHYDNGICRKVEIHGMLFNAQMILQE